MSAGAGRLVLDARRAFTRWHRRRLLRRHAARRAADYLRWIEAFDRPDAALEAATRARLAAAAGPSVAFIIAADTAPSADLQATLRSLREQWYGHWTAMVLTDGPMSSIDDARVSLGEARRAAPRDSGRGAAWRAAALEADAHWIAPLAAGVRLAPHALAALVLSLNPRTQIVYADHDTLDAQGRRCDPVFKGDFDPEFLLAVNELLPLALFRRDVLRAALAGPHGCEPGVPAPALPQLWHALALHATAHAPADAVRHVPHVLAQVPAAPHPAAAPTGSTEAVRHHLQALGRRAEVRDDGLGGCEVRFTAPDPLPLVSVIVPTRDRLGLLRRCVEGVLRQTDYPALELIVVDNGSREPATQRYLDSLAADPRVVVLHNDAPFNYSALNNLAAGRARGELLLLLNNDIEVIEPGWLRKMAAHAVRPEIGAVGARLWYQDFTLQHGGLVVGLHGVAGDTHPRLPRGEPGGQGRAVRLQSCSALTAACLLVRRSVYLESGGLDAERLAVAYNDVDFCLKLRLRGLRNVWVPQAELLHHESRSRGRDDQGERARRLAAEREVMRQRWGWVLEADPYYNPNLALEGRAASMAWPPRVTLPDTLLRDRSERLAGLSVGTDRPAIESPAQGPERL